MHVQKSAAPAAERKQVPTAAPECATAAAAGMQDLTDASIQSLINWFLHQRQAHRIKLNC